MELILVKKLDEFARNHANARKNLATWKQSVEIAVWHKKQDVLVSFPNAKILKSNRARFEIVHNTYRLIAEIDYEDRTVAVRFIGTHTEYERIDPLTV